MRSFLLALFIPLIAVADAFVAYEVSGGRFGDHLSDYFHGRWIEHKTGIPLLYSPFAFSDALVLHQKQNGLKKEEIVFNRTVQCYREEDALHTFNNDEKVLFWIPHFTTFSIDSVINVPLGNPYFPKCFLADWRDKEFLAAMREEVSPLSSSLKLFKPEEGTTSIALHFRDGGGIDKPEWLWCFPLRFPPKQFYKKALADLVKTVPPGPLFVGIFTDSRTPNEVRDEFAHFLAETFPTREIKVVLSTSSKGDGAGVLEDFFSMETFQYVIGAESLYSQNAARLGNCQLTIRPQVFAQDPEKGNLFAPTAIDMAYKMVPNDQIVSFQPKGVRFEQDLEEIVQRAWYCYQRDYFFDLTMPSPLYERLNLSFLKPIEREGEAVIDKDDLSPLDAIDWNDQLFLMSLRAHFVPKMAFQMPANKEIPSIALLDTVEDLEPYFSLVEQKKWKKHQVTLVFSRSIDEKRAMLQTLYLQRKLKKLGVVDVEVNYLSLVKDPLEAFVAVGFHDYIITTPSLLVETAAKIFCPKPAIVVK